MDHDDDSETSYNTFVDDVAFEPTYSQALLTAAGRNVATRSVSYQSRIVLPNSNNIPWACLYSVAVFSNTNLVLIYAKTALATISRPFVSVKTSRMPMNSDVTAW